MRKELQVTGIEDWLDKARLRFVNNAPELLPLFETYSAEARFGRRYIDSDLERLQRNARILEVGAGSLLLSCQLVIEGFEVTALEPTGEGFSHFDRMREIVLEEARSEGCSPLILNLPAEKLSDANRFDYAFSVNVMEHVDDVALVLINVTKSLTGGAQYRFTCPNYIFPYEPHFNVPTLFSKQLTEKALGKFIFSSRRVTDPVGTWTSLNWINVRQVGRYVKQQQGLKLFFNRTILVTTLDRMVTDSEFAARRSVAMRLFLAMLVRMRIHVLFAFVPAFLQPIMDCSVQKINSSEVC